MIPVTYIELMEHVRQYPAKVGSSSAGVQSCSGLQGFYEHTCSPLMQRSRWPETGLPAEQHVGGKFIVAHLVLTVQLTRNLPPSSSIEGCSHVPEGLRKVSRSPVAQMIANS